MLISQGISNFGDTFQLIAATALLVKMTGSGFAAGFSLVCIYIPSILLSPVAGILGDRLKERHILILVDLMRGFVAFSFTLDLSVTEVYLLIAGLSSLDVIYGPSRNKFITQILTRDGLVIGNSIQGGISGVAYMFGPVLAGIVVELWGVDAAFSINSLSFIISAFLIAFAYDSGFLKSRNFKKQRLSDEFSGFIQNFILCFKDKSIRSIIKTGSVINFCTLSVNLTFYTFAFDILKVSNSGWGAMISTIYGTSLLAMLINLILKERVYKNVLRFIYILVFIISGVWFSYGLTNDISKVMLLQIVEGTTLALISIHMCSYLLACSNKNHIATTSACYDFANYGAKLTSIIITYNVLRFLGPSPVFMINALILLMFLSAKLILATNR